jgi:hypothetical protein
MKILPFRLFGAGRMLTAGRWPAVMKILPFRQFGAGCICAPQHENPAFFANKNRTCNILIIRPLRFSYMKGN